MAWAHWLLEFWLPFYCCFRILIIKIEDWLGVMICRCTRQKKENQYSIVKEQKVLDPFIHREIVFHILASFSPQRAILINSSISAHSQNVMSPFIMAHSR